MDDTQDGVGILDMFRIIGEKEAIIFQQQKTLTRLNRQIEELLQQVGELRGQLEQPNS